MRGFPLPGAERPPGTVFPPRGVFLYVFKQIFNDIQTISMHSRQHVENVLDGLSTWAYQVTPLILLLFFFLVSIPSYSQANLIQEQGPIGIGTTSPEAPLDVRTQEQSGTIARFLSNQGMPNTGEHRWAIQVGRVYDFPNRTLDFGMVSESFGTSPAFFVSPGGTERFRITSNGMVGIGTSNPSRVLEVVGGMVVNGSQTTNRISQSGGTYTELAQMVWGGGGAMLFSAYGVGSYVDGGLTASGNTKHRFNSSVFGSETHGPGMIYFGGNRGEMQFYVGPVSTGQDSNVAWGTPVLHLNRAGNVGIGTTTPTHKLEVNGTVRAKEVKLEVSSWPDYVFLKGYELLSLTEVEEFIERNGRLPGLGSAEEYETLGVNMMDLNLRLVEKIEELTLYVIDQDKKLGELEKLKEEVELLKQMVSKAQ